VTSDRLARDRLGFEDDFARHLVTTHGKRFVMEAWERAVGVDFFAGVRESLWMLPKSNGKSAWLAALAVHHLLVTADAEVVIVASSRDQARLIYKHAVGFIRRSPGLRDQLLVREGSYEIRSRRDGGFLRVLASSEDTVDGYGPTLALIDEGHRHSSRSRGVVMVGGIPLCQVSGGPGWLVARLGQGPCAEGAGVSVGIGRPL